MKKILITLSLVANAALLLGLASPATFNRIVPFAQLGEADPASAATGSATGVRPPATRRPVTGPLVSLASLRSVPPAELVAQLRAAGLPESLVRSIVTAELASRTTARRRELLALHGDIPYWKNPPPGGGLTPAETAELRELSKNVQAQLRQLLGPAPLMGFGGILQASQFGPLPADKIAQIQRINQDYGEIASEIRGPTSLVLLPEERERLAFLEVEKEKDLRATLTPEEYEEYTFRSSNSGNNLRNSLQYFNPTEAEFRAMFALQREFDLKYSSQFAGMNPELSRERAAASQQLAADLKNTISVDRLADYERAIDGNFRNLAQVATRYQIPLAAVTPIYDLQKELQVRANTIRADRNLTPQARMEQLTGLQAEATNRMSTAFGSEKAFEAYKGSGGQWIQGLVPQPANAPAASGATIILR